MKATLLCAPRTTISPLPVLVSKQLEFFVETVSYIQFNNYILQPAATMYNYNYVLECDDGEIHLVGGTSNSEGTVEICFGNLWGLITESGWTDNDASVVCKQLGFLGEGILSQFT